MFLPVLPSEIKESEQVSEPDDGAVVLDKQNYFQSNYLKWTSGAYTIFFKI